MPCCPLVRACACFCSGRFDASVRRVLLLAGTRSGHPGMSAPPPVGLPASRGDTAAAPLLEGTPVCGGPAVRCGSPAASAMAT
jgi:hypothetical protein